MSESQIYQAESNNQVSKWINPQEDTESFKVFGQFLEANFAGANSKNLCV
jgi:hypothetical protein